MKMPENTFKVIIVGCGRIGYTIAKSLSSGKGIEVTVIDNDSEAFAAAESLDVLRINGECLEAETLNTADAKNTDLIVSVTASDEKNLLCCSIAKRLGVKKSIARVRNPEHFDLNVFHRDFNVDMLINPEDETAIKILRLLKLPPADDIHSFTDDKVELVSYTISESDTYFTGRKVDDVINPRRMDVSLAVVERNGIAIIPREDFIFEKRDVLRILGDPSSIRDFFKVTGENSEEIRDAVIIGGGKIAEYLANQVYRRRRINGINFKIIEINAERCEDLSVKYRDYEIINGSGTDEDILDTEIIGHTEAVICLTNEDDKNIIAALYSRHAKNAKTRKVVLRINHINRNMVSDLGIGSVVVPSKIIAEKVIAYVRDLNRSGINNAKEVYRIIDDGTQIVEAMSFEVGNELKTTDMQLKDNILIGCIIRGSEVIIPSGGGVIKKGDNVIIIAKDIKLSKLDDILKG
ncbi:potassium transporter peripheral membrane protein [Spirochaetia bacterium]|nr:potassium transporter peripheral membrane protein [Spirochaetia bacterium]